MAKHKKARKDQSGTGDSLAHNPFAALAHMQVTTTAKTGGDDELSTHVEPSVNIEKADVSESAKPAWAVQKTRKGGWDLHIEKRGGGKIVTRLQGVSGDAARLLKACKKHCGSGGVLREGGIELQGDQREALWEFLQHN